MVDAPQTRDENSMHYGHESRLPAVGRDTAHVIFYSDQVGYFLSPLDFLKQLLTFFLFRAAFKRLVLLRFFMFTSISL